MQAALYHEFGGPIRIQSIPIPSLQEDEGDAVLLQVKATGVCRSDYHGWMGHDADIGENRLPHCPGHEVSGVIVETGRQVKRSRVGDRVAVPFILSCGRCDSCRDGMATVCTHQEQPGFTRQGSFAEYVLIPRADRNLCLLPSQVSFVQAAALGCRFSTAYRAIVQQARLLPNESIAVMGVGGVGLACCMIARAVGCQQVIAIDTNSDALAKSLQCGATHTILSTIHQSTATATQEENVPDKVRALTPGQGGGAHVTVDAAGFAATCEAAVRSTRRGGRMIQVGLIGPDHPPNVPMGLVAAHELHIIGSHGFDSAALSDLLELVASGHLDPGRLVSSEVTLEEGVQVLEAMKHSSPLGMVMITQFPHNSRM